MKKKKTQPQRIVTLHGRRVADGSYLVEMTQSQFLQLVRPAKVKHEALKPDTEQRLHALWERVKDIDHCATYEQFEADFARDETPEKEVAIYEKILATLDVYIATHPEAHRKECYGMLQSISMGVKIAHPAAAWKELSALYGPPDLVKCVPDKPLQ